MPFTYDWERSEYPADTRSDFDLQERLGEAHWFDVNRGRGSESREIDPAGCVPLAEELLEARDLRPAEEWAPDNVFDPIGGARPIGRVRPRMLRRFDGTPVEPAVFTQIYNGESRGLYRPDAAPWVRIGQITTRTGRGSAALIGRNTVITAAHVVSDSWSSGGPVVGSPTFTPAMFNGASTLGRSWVANIVGVAAWEQFVGQDGYDIAICQLDQPMGEWLGYFGYRGYDDDWEDLAVWTHAGYPYDLSPNGDYPSVEYDIKVEDDDSDKYDTVELETKADIASGQSGGPLWARFRNGGRQITGVLSGREDNFAEPKNSLFAGGNGLVSLARWGRDNWG